MGQVIPFNRIPNPDPAEYSMTAQRVAIDYLSTMTVYGVSRERLMTCTLMAEAPRAVRLIVRLTYDLNGDLVGEPELGCSEHGSDLAGAAHRRFIRAAEDLHVQRDIGNAISGWIAFLWERYRARVVEEDWQYLVSLPDRRDWIACDL